MEHIWIGIHKKSIPLLKLAFIVLHAYSDMLLLLECSNWHFIAVYLVNSCKTYYYLLIEHYMKPLFCILPLCIVKLPFSNVLVHSLERWTERRKEIFFQKEKQMFSKTTDALLLFNNSSDI